MAHGVAGTQTFQQSEAPGYKSGKVSIVACLSAQVVVCFALRFGNDRLNQKNRRAREAMSEEERAVVWEQLAYSDETDLRNPFFTYTH